MIVSSEFYSPFLEAGSTPCVRIFFPGIEYNIIFLFDKARERSFILHLQPSNCLPNFTDYLVRKCGPYINKLHSWELNHLRGDKKAGAIYGSIK
jgi:hypothetical protein